MARYPTAVDVEISSWIEDLSMQLRDIGIQEEDEPHWEDDWWRRP